MVRSLFLLLINRHVPPVLKPLLVQSLVAGQAEEEGGGSRLQEDLQIPLGHATALVRADESGCALLPAQLGRVQDQELRPRQFSAKPQGRGFRPFGAGQISEEFELYHLIDTFCKFIAKRDQKKSEEKEKSVDMASVMEAVGIFAFREYASKWKNPETIQELPNSYDSLLQDAVEIGLLWEGPPKSPTEALKGSPPAIENLIFPRRLFLEYFAAVGAVNNENRLAWPSLIGREPDRRPFLYFCSGLERLRC